MKVLYVEDDRDIREVGTMALQTDANIEVCGASSGAEALIKLQTGEHRPDVILLDVMMAGMDGIATFKHIEAIPRLASIPVIFVTAQARASEHSRLIALGGAGVIIKPFDPISLAGRVREIVALSAKRVPAADQAVTALPYPVRHAP